MILFRNPVFTRLNFRRKPLRILAGLAGSLLILYLDFVTGPTITFYVFYALLVAYAVWNFGRPAGFFLAMFFPVTSMFMDMRMEHHHFSDPGVILWSTLIRITLYIVTCYLVHHLRLQMIEKHRHIRRLQKAHNEIRRLTHIKSDFINMLSHEVRTPLTAIKGSIELLNEDRTLPFSADQRECLELCLGTVNRLNRLVSEVLNLNRLEAKSHTLNLQPGNLNNLITAVADFYRPLAAKRGLLLKTDVDYTLPDSRFDYDAMSQVLHNLVGNALKFTEHGHITLMSRQAGSSAVEITVRDTGTGIPRESLDRIFQPFNQAGEGERHKAGTGLGLTIVRQIIEGHSGHILAESEDGKGTTIRIHLPATPEPSAINTNMETNPLPEGQYQT